LKQKHTNIKHTIFINSRRSSIIIMGDNAAVGRMFGLGNSPVLAADNQEVEQTSYCGKLGDSCTGMSIGIVLLLASLGAAGWNEYSNVAMMKSITEAQSIIQSVPNCNTIPTSLEGQLVHVTCPLSNLQVLGRDDPMLQGISPENRTGLALNAYMEVNQWTEKVSTTTTTNKVGGGQTTTKTYSYYRKWLPSTPAVNTSFFRSGSRCASQNGGRSCLNWDPAMESWWSSSSFGGYSLGNKVMESATNVMAGNYVLPDKSIQNLGSAIVLTPSCAVAGNATNTTTTTTTSTSGSLACAPGGPAYVKGTQAGPKIFWQKQDSNGQAIDYLSRSYTLRTAKVVSILAQQQGNTFVMWESSYDSDYGMFIFTEGNWTAHEMFAVEQAKRAGLTWFLRVLTLVLVIGSLFMITYPLTQVPDIIPCIGDFIGDLVGYVLWAVDCMLGCCCWSTVVALCWLAYRPNIAIPLLCVSIGLVVLSIVAAIANHRKRREEEEDGGVGKMDEESGKMDPPAEDDDDDDDYQNAVEEEADIEVQEAYIPDYVEEAEKR
jgi:Transmembrane protein 43